ncbi:MAG: zinc ABC transporter substrate-binding protein [Paracoccus sp. (in: a-proteobacteria)]|nr:zinc ABC transporter substrate-binding protein [Paracoccus sp. (in: a-proteobacteria)]
MRAHYLLGLALIPGHAFATPLQIVTDMPVTASLVQQVTGDLAEVHILLDGGADPHDFQLRPSQARALQNADLLVWMGPELTVWLQTAAEALGEDRQMALLHQPGTVLRSYPDTDHASGHGDHDHAHDDHGHGHDHAGIDPHAWLDPDNGRLWLDQIARRLTELDPENTARYGAQATRRGAGLAALDMTLAAELAPAQAHPFVSFHDAYGYFTDHYGLPPAITVTIGDASAPSAARLQSVRAAISASGARCVFPEVGHSSRMIDTVAGGLALAKGAEISPTGADIPPGEDLYEQLLRDLAQRILECTAASR